MRVLRIHSDPSPPQPSSRYVVDPLWVELNQRYRRAQAELALARWSDRVRLARGWPETLMRRCG